MTDETKNVSKFCVAGNFEIDEQMVPVVAETGEEIKVELAQPAKLGSAMSVGAWLNNSWATEVPILLLEKPGKNKKVPSQSKVTKDQVVENLKKHNIPAQLQERLAELLIAEIYISYLYFYYKKQEEKETKAFKFGLSVNFPEGLELFAEIKLKDVSVMVSSAPPGYAFPEEKPLPVKELEAKKEPKLQPTSE